VRASWVAAGKSPAAQALLGRTVGVIGGAMYAQLRSAKLGQCLAFPDGTRPSECASWFVNPLTALGCVRPCARRASRRSSIPRPRPNLGQMLVKLCLADGVPLVNIVRKPEQAKLLQLARRGARRRFVRADLHGGPDPGRQRDGATLAFDATGGGKLASQILTAMRRLSTRRRPSTKPATARRAPRARSTSTAASIARATEA
jgi:NADPH2:quinone reductase